MIVVKPDKGRHLDEGGRTSVNGLPSPLLVRMHPGATKPFSVADEAALKQRRPNLLVDQISGFGHVRHYPQRDLPPVPPRRFREWRAKGQGNDRGSHGTVCFFQHQHFPGSRSRRVSRGVIGKLIYRPTEERVGPCPLESRFCCGVALCPGIAVLPNPSSYPAALGWRRCATLLCTSLTPSRHPNAARRSSSQQRS